MQDAGRGAWQGPNRASGLAHAVAAPGPETRFLVQEIGVASSGPGSLDELLWALEPRALARVALCATHDVRCWRTNCGKRLPCTMCERLGPVL